MRLGWTFEEVDERLHAIMKEIHRNCVKFGTQEDGTVNYVDGANIAGFVKVADAMLSQGELKACISLRLEKKPRQMPRFFIWRFYR